jgi:hypothetical protein
MSETMCHCLSQCDKQCGSTIGHDEYEPALLACVVLVKRLLKSASYLTDTRKQWYTNSSRKPCKFLTFKARAAGWDADS